MQVYLSMKCTLKYGGRVVNGCITSLSIVVMSCGTFGGVKNY